MNIIKRNGLIVKFNKEKIVNAIECAMRETEVGIDNILSDKIATSIENKLINKDAIKTVDEISDIVEQRLMSSNRKDVAKQYILYREYRNNNRVSDNGNLLTDEFISKYKHLPNPMKPLGEFVYYRTYSRWIEEENRREYWWETVRRAVEYNCSLVPNVSKKEAEELYDNIFNLRQFLSGRTLWVGGTPVSNEYGCSNYNCAFCVIDDFVKFKELFYLLMIGAGVGFRVLKSDVNKMPKIRTNIQVLHKEYTPVLKSDREDSTSLSFSDNVAKITIGDSKEGWSQSLEYYFKLLTESEYKNIHTIMINYDNVRPKGERLKKFGGTASGHNSLLVMFDKITGLLIDINKESNSSINKLRPIHCMDICNIIGENVVVGGVRRTAEVGLIDVDDEECIKAKSGLYSIDEYGNYNLNKKIAHRQMSNNSILYFEKPSYKQLEWQIKQMRQSGEPAFMNMESSYKRRKDCQGGNPCMEILLRDRGLCNLTTINVMAFVKDGILDIDGLLQAQKMSVRSGLRMTCLELELHKWNQVQSEDRLLGCSFTGFRDAVDSLNYTNKQEDELERKMRECAHNEARLYASELGIPEPLLVTTVKPEGTLSLLAGVSSGLHYTHSEYYIRRIRINADDPLVKVCEELRYPVFPENGQDIETCTTKVIEFPVKSPSNITKYDVTAIKQLENYLSVMKNYADHNASITVTVRPHEWEEVTQWVYDNWDETVAVSFLPLDDSFYELLPYESITKEEYEKRFNSMAKFRPSLLGKYEKQEVELDVGSSECIGGVCPIR